MTIAAHFFSSKEQPSFLLPCFLIIATQNPGDTFIIFIDPQQHGRIALPANCRLIPVSPPIKNGLLMHYWYNFKLPALLKKYNVSAFISETGACSIRTVTPQAIFLSDLVMFGKKKSPGVFATYIKRFFPRFVQTAAAVIVPEEVMVTKLSARYPLISNKISSCRYGLPAAYRQVEPEEHTSLLEEFAGGYEYFLSECSVHTKQGMLAILKAYSLFKKRLKSGIRLVILLRGVTAESCIPDFKNYKYRGEVSFVNHRSDEHTALLFAAAYAFLCFPGETTIDNAGLFAMRAYVPVISADTTDNRLIYGEAALFSVPDEKGIADNMILLYKDENLRNEVIHKGSQLASSYTWNHAAGRVWQTILNIGRD